MTSAISCPKCKNVVRTKNDTESKTLKCGQCGFAFKGTKAHSKKTPKPNETKEPRKNKARQEPAKKSKLLPALIGGGGAVVVVAGTIVVGAFLWWNANRTQNPIAQNPNPTEEIHGAGFFGFGGVSFSQDERFLVAASNDNKVHVFQTKDGKLVRTLPTQFDEVTGVASSPDGSHVFVSGGVGKVAPAQLPNNPTYIAKIHVASGKEERFPGVVGAFHSLKVSPDGSRLYGVGADYSLRAWDAHSGNLAHSWENLFRVPYGMELSRDGKIGVMVIETGPVVLNLENGRDTLKLPEGARSLRILGETSRAAATNDHKTLKIWDLKTGAVVKSFDLVDRDSAKGFGIIRSSADGKWISISGSHVGRDLYHVIDATNGKLVFRYRIDAYDGEQFASSSGNLVAFRNVNELRLVEIPPMPKR